MLTGNKPFFIACYENIPCGYVSFDSSLAETTISIAVSSEFRNRGIGTEILKRACFRVLTTTKITKIIALIKCENIASQKVFSNAFFVEIENSLENIDMIMEYPAYDELFFTNLHTAPSTKAD